ncbi:MAG: 30S ribosome-binding factor RbfA [Fusobacteria bacterium]|nr:30S ribosome-binding factor RbfA [Fusobacteriota bacterium]
MKKQRSLSIEKEITKVVGQVFFEGVKNDKISGMVSVVKTVLSRDKKYADVYLSVLPINNQEINTEILQEGFNEIRGYVRKKVAEEMKLRYTPEVRLKLDDSIEYGVKISKIINELK